MSEPSESPIISRLKDFMAYSQMSNSQFADFTGIPRPTLSQLLHGRNKSINDQLIRKLHDSFPTLNIVWLLFGKGDMLTDGNSDFSAAAGRQSEVVSESQTNDNKQNSNPLTGNAPTLFSFNNQVEDVKESQSEQRSAAETPGSFENRNPMQVPPRTAPGADAAKAASLQSNQEKKISSIIVFYTDNSFETFLPA